ncbi:MAG: hypothetical protein ACR2IV_22875 [Bryobacteraceae bacterium]
MKLQVKNIFLTAGLSALLGSLTISAQEQKEIANIPFAYHVGEQTLAAGKYTVQETNSGGVLQLRDNTSGHSIFVSVLPADTGRKDSKLTFSCYAGECSLSQIWMAGDVYSLRSKPFPREAKNQIGVLALVSVPLLRR